ncbi:DUF3500 domain-containing protein [Roseateles oligotrophus]|uniref:DUF3500 domain-containing protein n=1 Tax=Roseateles oligotrophus TaxID=1769250 RepID=A0ABT2YHU5_9BURK|nr:DUF3500 domain-containing protein [Roseateles oligotrophus]MCV2369598.1 DUF3500 domain-containing protein [Roseateles oligotrophus]
MFSPVSIKVPRPLARCWPLLLAVFVSALVACGGGSGGASTTADADTAPSISTQPASLTVEAGAAVNFSVTAAGTATLAYQWRKGGSAIGGATAASLSLASASTADAGSYDVVVSNSAGSVTSSAATLTVTSASTATTPSITTQPVSQTVVLGGGASFSVAASGTAPLSYQWALNGSAIANATASTYTNSSVAAGHAGPYTVTVSNSAGSATSNAATLTVSSSSTSSGALSAVVTTAAQAFYATLSSTQQTKVQASWSLDAGRRWSNLPASFAARNGVSWSSLSTAQKTSAAALINTALGSTGNTLWQGLQAADDYLASIGGGSGYGNGNYYIAFLGTPSATGYWVLQLTGHHLTYSLAFNGSVKSPTPMFLGVEPKASFTINGATYDPMLAQRTAAASLGTTLTSYSGALLSGTYADLLFGANGSGGIDGSYPKSYPSGSSGRGLLYTALSAADQEKVKTLIRSYVNTQASEYSEDLLGAYLSDAALAQTYVAYAGGGNVTSSGSYFRVDGPRVWIEFSVQRGIIVSNDIHFHTIWRDKTGDYGGRCCS